MTETKDHADLVERLCDSVDLLRNFPTRPVPGKLSPVDGRHLDVIQQEIEEAAQALTTQAARIAELEGALRDCADDLEAEIKARAVGELPRRIARDLEPVLRARTALEPKP